MGPFTFILYAILGFIAPYSRWRMEWRLFRLLNQERRDEGLPTLFMQGDLRQLARKHSKDMAKQGYFDHVNRQGQSHADRFVSARISEATSGENLAKIRGYAYPVERAHQGLMKSPGHRANILNTAYNCVGIGLHKAKDGTYYFTQNFAYRSLLFTRKFPKSLSRGQKHTLYFTPLDSANQGLIKVILGQSEVQQKAFPIRPGENKLDLRILDAGLHTLQIYTGNKGRLKLANLSEIKVKKGW
jgi:hypothetical protein